MFINTYPKGLKKLNARADLVDHLDQVHNHHDLAPKAARLVLWALDLLFPVVVGVRLLLERRHMHPVAGSCRSAAVFPPVHSPYLVAEGHSLDCSHHHTRRSRSHIRLDTDRIVVKEAYYRREQAFAPRAPRKDAAVLEILLGTPFRRRLRWQKALLSLLFRQPPGLCLEQQSLRSSS
jgi:hypothetical protein